jgi:hypothetical protein
LPIDGVKQSFVGVVVVEFGRKVAGNYVPASYLERVTPADTVSRWKAGSPLQESLKVRILVLFSFQEMFRSIISCIPHVLWGEISSIPG